MTRPKLRLQVYVLLTLCAGLCLALPQEFFELEEVSGPASAPPPAPAPAPVLSDPSDLSAGLNLVPVTNLIIAAGNAVPPAPVQFIRVAMNSGL